MMTARPGQSPQRVLIVEDEFFIADSLAAAFSIVGVEVIGPAYTIAQALAFVKAGRIHGAILDINLRGEAAFSVADALSANNIPFLFTTGYDVQQLDGKYQHIIRFEKPFDPARVVAVLLKDMVR